MTETKTWDYPFYKGRPVKRMRKGPHGIILTMYNRVKNKPGAQLTVSQEEWETHGERRTLPVTPTATLRQMS